MASSSKKKTTMAKMNRETAVRERRLRKQAKKDARKQAAADGLSEPSDAGAGEEPEAEAEAETETETESKAR